MPEKSLKKNYFYNLSYQIIQIVIPFITAPYVSRVLTVKGIGIQSFTQSIASYFLLFINFPIIKILSVLLLIIGLNVFLGIQYLVPQKKEMAFTIIVSTGAVVNFMLNMILIPKYQSVGAATSSVIAESIIMIFYFIYTKGTLNIKEIVLHLWRYIVASVIMFTILSTIKSIMMSNIVSLICIILISGIVYFVSLLLLRDKLLFSIISTIIVYIKKKRFI